MTDELLGGYHSAPVRHGDTVVRAAGAWSPNVQALLRHFERVGFTQAPKFLSTDDATETLSYITGQPGTYPLNEQQRSDEALTQVARTIRAMHDATTGFVSPEPGNWQYRTTIPADVDCIGHNDLGPYNVVYDGARVAAIIDWDFAGPSNRIWDLCYAAHRFVPLSAPRSTKAFGWDLVPDQAARLRLFADAYGRGVTPAELLDLLIVRLSSIAAYIETKIRLGDPWFDRQRDERHTDAYREDIQYILANREHLLGSG
ncbi:phosphotransferase [Sphaerimonospora cavernae]|uniref:Phosphotransferase n=1 Tax=Sphaerimonospora cavernae TaxID=1740611 RepID=A0ABV6U9F0_9ACTN